MKLGIIKRILKDDLARSGELPPWLDAFLQPLNDFIEKVGSALQNRLTFADNFLCKIVSQSFNSGVEYQITPNLTGGNASLKVIAVLVLDAGGGTVDKFRWSRKSSGNIGVTITFSDVASSTCSIILLLG
jgi:hypothetical protein